MAEFRSPYVPGLPRFTGGAVGVVAYDASPTFEPVLNQAWSEAKWARDQRNEDDAGFMLFDTVLAFDHVKHRILIIANARITADENLEALYQFACAKIQFLERELERGLSQPEKVDRPAPEVRSNQSRETFEAGVRTIKEHIAAGDIYQAVLSQRFEADVTADPFTVYRALRHVNPSPYMYFMRMGGLAIVGSSPEMLVRVEGRRVETHPIAGTRPRGATDDEDLRLAEELKRNEKERAEHVMLVDLGRNDLGRVCEFGSVRVPQYMALERYSHVMHLVSTVDGRLAEDRDHLDALIACFPAGTVSGAPKIRAMQILASLEPTRRDVYAGAVGYIDFAGNLDFCIAIRTITIRNGTAGIQAGAGIVADSNPAAEYEETRDKARALLQALAMAERGL
jgi:anthranilate synthase component 1